MPGKGKPAVSRRGGASPSLMELQSASMIFGFRGAGRRLGGQCDRLPTECL